MHKTQLLWVQCEDFPLEGDGVTTLGALQLEQRRRQWLQRSDGKTGGVMGFFPLVKDLPVNFTVQLDRKRKILKHTEGTIHAWTLHADDAARVATSTQAEIILEHLPLQICVRKVHEEPMLQHLNLPPQVYGVSPKGVNWHVDAQKTLWVRRFGFPLRPDFASTVHAVTGAELKAAVVDLGDIFAMPNVDDAVKGYIGISRVSGHQDLRIAQPFAPAMFRLGRLELAYSFLKVQDTHCKFLRAEGPPVDQDELSVSLDKIESRMKTQLRELSHQKWHCVQCRQSMGHVHFLEDRTLMDTAFEKAIVNELVENGSLRRCTTCRSGRNQADNPTNYCKDCDEHFPKACFLDGYDDSCIEHASDDFYPSY